LRESLVPAQERRERHEPWLDRENSERTDDPSSGVVAKTILNQSVFGENRRPTKADFTYKIGPDAIEIADTGRGRLSVTEDLEAVMRRLEYWHMGSLSGFKISCRSQNGTRHEVKWDGRRALVSPAAP